MYQINYSYFFLFVGYLLAGNDFPLEMMQNFDSSPTSQTFF